MVRDCYRHGLACACGCPAVGDDDGLGGLCSGCTEAEVTEFVELTVPDIV